MSDDFKDEHVEPATRPRDSDEEGLWQELQRVHAEIEQIAPLRYPGDLERVCPPEHRERFEALKDREWLLIEKIMTAPGKCGQQR